MFAEGAPAVAPHALCDSVSTAHLRIQMTLIHPPITKVMVMGGSQAALT